jgi:hypothetical protein
VRFYYRNGAFALGWKITLACAAVLGYLVWRENSRAEGKYEKKKKEKR